MDDQGFDTLARVVAGLGSRRSLLRGLAAISSLAVWNRAAPRVAAQLGTLGPGDACYDDSQCSPSVMNYSPLVCADNGFDYDGPLNCCTGEDGFCFSDEGCCGSAYCDANQRCSYQSGAAPSYAANPGDPCQTNDQCQPPVTGTVCDYAATTNDYRCCWYEGSSCAADAQCCGNNVCWYGACTAIGSQGRVLPCTGQGCGCDPNGAPCDQGLFCCAPSDGGLYTCSTGEQCGFVSCTGIGCTCVGGMDSCDPGLMCCVQGDVGAIAVCLSVDACYATGPGCTSEGCTCAMANPFGCEGDLICCGPGEPDALGTCQYNYNC